MVRMTLADVVLDGLARAGTSRIFCAAGEGLDPPLLRSARRHGLGVVPARDLAAACVMASVTGDLNRSPGAALTRLGPGLATAGLARARLDGSPMILLTDGRPDEPPASRRSRPADARLFLGAVVKASIAVGPGSAADAIVRACRLALGEPPGPVHLDLGADAAEEPAVPVATALRPDGLPPPDRGALDRAARILAAATRPLLVAGGQCRTGEVAGWLRALAEALPAPVLVTPKAKGVLPDPHPLHLGLFLGKAIGAAPLARADLVVAIGLDPSELADGDWLGSGAAPPVLRLARSPDDRYRPLAEVVGEIGLAIEELAPRLQGRDRADWDVAELDRAKRAIGAERPMPTGGLGAARVVQIARELAPPGTIVSVDAGEVRGVVTATWPALAPGEYLVSNDARTPGFAVPAAIAARLAHPDRCVLGFAGEAGLPLAVADLETAARLGLSLAVIVLRGEGAPGVPVRDLPARPESVSIFTADGEAGLGGALRRALDARGPTLVEARVARYPQSR
ncbi:MAG: thiamine pyrophosphate-binding protein [Candidatus Rokubacteria bacterium]|nr:thiamine pyrophosphate-binding protein [Candidatus Rokubacteria bacterium]